MAKTLLECLVAQYPAAKRQTLKRMVEGGRVTIDGQVASRLKQEVAEGADVRVKSNPSDASRSEPRHGLAFEIIYEDADLLVVNKPAGLLTSTVPREPRPTLLAAVREYLSAADPGARIGLIHRLDRDASGLLVFSKSDVAYKSLKTQFFIHSVTRNYIAVVNGIPTPREGTIDTHLVERADGTVYSTHTIGKGRRAVTEYEVVSEGGGRSVVKLTLRSGRKHQIRVQLAERDVPIVGDSVYGQVDADGLHLAATTLAFDHPRSGERMTWSVAPPWEKKLPDKHEE